MSFYKAAEQVLRMTKKPMSSKEITKMALAKKLITTSGKTPDASMGAQLYVDMNRKGTKSKFILIDRGIFGFLT